MAMVSSPEAQYRLTVIPATSLPNALLEIFLPICSPCSPSGLAQPTMTSSIRDDSIMGYLAISALITKTARSSDLKFLNPPLLDLVTADRSPSMIYASMLFLFSIYNP